MGGWGIASVGLGYDETGAGAIRCEIKVGLSILASCPERGRPAVLSYRRVQSYVSSGKGSLPPHHPPSFVRVAAAAVPPSLDLGCGGCGGCVGGGR